MCVSFSYVGGSLVPIYEATIIRLMIRNQVLTNILLTSMFGSSTGVLNGGWVGYVSLLSSNAYDS